MLIALFTLGATMKNKPAGKPETIVIIGGKNYDPHTITIQGQQESAFFENIFQCSSLYQIIKEEPVTYINNSINSNIKQAVALSVKE
ncbi:hypothetical protein SAMN05660816_00666 [Niastella yeongjuensis]|nr:hypothetical protein SAMN05660816_00666 [Niastella yeongjuensis]